MTDQYAQIRKHHFSGNWLPWAVIHHFLPTPLLRELMLVIVERLSNGTIEFGELFDDAITKGPSSLDSWLLRPLEVSAPLATYLQYRIRAFAWQNDADIPVLSAEDSSARITPLAFERVIKFGIADFSWSDDMLSQLDTLGDPPLERLVAAFKLARASIGKPVDSLAPLIAVSTDFESPLDIVVLKHLGDLCADADGWHHAKALYAEAQRRLKKAKIDAWEDLGSLLGSIMTQSESAAARTLADLGSAASLLAKAFANASTTTAPLLFINAPHDYYVAAAYSAGNLVLPPDKRAVLMLPPLANQTHGVGHAVQSFLAGKFTDANARFWAVLRRQVALGSTTDSRGTKALFAQNIIAELRDVGRVSAPAAFRTAVRLLTESGDYASAAKILWTDQVVAIYVDSECIEFAISYAQSHPGASLERHQVLVELFRAWVEHSAVEARDAVTRMMAYIAGLATAAPSSMLAGLDLGRHSLEALKTIAKARPEFRSAAAGEVSSALSAKLRAEREFWGGKQAALETAVAFLDVFEGDALLSLIDSTLYLLEHIDPATDMYPLVGPAMDLLTSTSAKDCAETIPHTGERIVNAILRFGMEQASQHTRLLHYLRNFGSSTLLNGTLPDALQKVVADVRRQARQVGSSNAIENIQALLVVPFIAGREGIVDALDCLASVMRTALGGSPVISFPFAYGPLLLLADEKSRIETETTTPIATVRSWLQPILTLTIDVWRAVASRPLLFATFSIPVATKPDSIVVHNWAFASMRFAASLHEEGELHAAIDDAAGAQPVLRDAIALARATRSLREPLQYVDPDAIRAEARDLFYASLGRRLVLLQRLDAATGRDFCKALIDQCFRLGPKELDAGVFVSAERLDLKGYIADADHADYMKRLENSRDLRLAISPILDMLSVTSTD